jgi:uncharacterized protein (DUF433 family)
MDSLVLAWDSSSLIRRSILDPSTSNVRSAKNISDLNGSARVTVAPQVETERSELTNLLERITINPDQCGGRPCICGMRIRVIDVLDLFAAGLTSEQTLEEMPDLETEDLREALDYVARRLDHFKQTVTVGVQNCCNALVGSIGRPPPENTGKKKERRAGNDTSPIIDH